MRPKTREVDEGGSPLSVITFLFTDIEGSPRRITQSLHDAEERRAEGRQLTLDQAVDLALGGEA